MSDSPNQAIIESLQNPDVWPHPVESIQLLETHISWILLTGPFAYKIKKPVDFGFVDFTTLERRRHFCEEELRLNRRLAAELYLEVIPITGTRECAVPGGSGDPIEFALKMRQFSQDLLLNHLIERDELTAQHIDCLADEVSQFHAHIKVAEMDGTFGTPAAVDAPVEGNFQHLVPVNEPDSTNSSALSSQIDTLHDWSRQQFEALESTFLGRLQDGYVRNCHGDMHLGNMFLERQPQQSGLKQPDRIVIFDCIEFNEAFRWTDVMSEVAFVVMDLQDRSRPDFSWRFLNRYLEQTGDYAGLSVLRFYLVYRALVRAKVAALRAAQHDVTAAEMDSIQAELRQYVELAVNETKPRPTPLIITHGFSGSGKSFGTQPVVEQLGAVRIRSDVERRRLFQDQRRPQAGGQLNSGIYTSEHTRHVYSELETLASQVIAAGFPVIVDATFLDRSRRDQFRELAERLGVGFFIANFDAPESELRTRILQRQQAGTDASEADLRVLDQQLRSHDPIDEDERQSIGPMGGVIEMGGGDSSAAELLDAIERGPSR